MHIIIVGGGVVGVSSAVELLNRGHTVELFESREGVALETSHANGGVLSPSMSEPWNAPGVWKDLIASFFNPRSPMKLHPSAVPGLAMWGLRFLFQSSPARFCANTKASYALCAYSVEQTNRWVKEWAIDCDYQSSLSGEGASGDLKIFQSPKAAEGSIALVEMLKPLGLVSELLTTEQVMEKEPTLAGIKDKIACGLYNRNDAAGDAAQFTQSLVHQLRDRGAKIHLNSPVSTLRGSRQRVDGVNVGTKVYGADAVIVAAASASAMLTGRFGIGLPIRPVKGYSLTIDASHIQLLPKLPVVNHSMHAVVNPLGKRIRIAGTAEFTRKTTNDLPRARVENLMDLFRATYPDIAAQIPLEEAKPWCGFRPMTTDGKPYVGASEVAGLYVNSGHGYLGWTQAVGCARLLSDLIEAKTPEIDPSPYALVGRASI
jgi:D-amino-acid dehydrogenase